MPIPEKRWICCSIKECVCGTGRRVRVRAHWLGQQTWSLWVYSPWGKRWNTDAHALLCWLSFLSWAQLPLLIPVWPPSLTGLNLEAQRNTKTWSWEGEKGKEGPFYVVLPTGPRRSIVSAPSAPYNTVSAVNSWRGLVASCAPLVWLNPQISVWRTQEGFYTFTSKESPAYTGFFTLRVCQWLFCRRVDALKLTSWQQSGIPLLKKTIHLRCQMSCDESNERKKKSVFLP